MTQMIIGLTGPAGCGKSTAATGLITAGFLRRVVGYLFRRPKFVRRRFAGPLKDMLLALGLTKEHTDGSLKEVPCDLLGGKTPRWAMQTLGTEWGRALITEDLWIRAWQASFPSGDHVVIDDCRFPNEAVAIRALGGKIIRIEREGYAHTVTHESEAHELEADVTVTNDGTIDELVDKLRTAIKELYR